MPTNNDSLPLPFYIACLVIAIGMASGWAARRQGWGLPVIAVLATISVWYVGDVFYNDYSEYYNHFGPEYLEQAWWQVLLFATAFILLAPLLNSAFNSGVQGRGSMMVRFYESRTLEHPEMQRRITHAASGLFVAWAILMVVALIRTRFDFIGLFAPYLGHRADPWGRGRIGGGIDAVLSLANYVQVFLTAGAGIVAAVARNRSTRSIALAICAVALPYYIFDRTRNTMLATVLPGLLSWVFLRLSGGIVVKVAVLAAAFLGVNAWFTFVMANRTDVSVAAAAAHEEARSEFKGRHDGLNMFEELGWINYLMGTGAYKPNMGGRYFAELVNPIPRVIWKEKPEIGIDYALARGQGGASAELAGVFATISTGMIGQGVVNFGVFFGPIAAAALMAGWSALLARQDLLGRDPARLLLYAMGMTLTFNIGRDITFLVLYPFLFGLAMLKAYYMIKPPPQSNGARAPGRGQRPVHRPPPTTPQEGDDSTQGISRDRL